MIGVVFKDRCLNWFFYRIYEHPLTHLMESLIIDHTACNDLQHIPQTQFVPWSKHFCTGKQRNILVKNEATVAINIECGLSLYCFYSFYHFFATNIVMFLLNEEIDASMIDYN